MRYLVIIRRTSTGYSADAPDLPGCVAAGRTVERTCVLMIEALELHLDAMIHDGETVPLPAQRVDLGAEDLSDGEFCTWVEVAVPNFSA